MAQTAAILAVGSELLSGQTLNRNAAWLSNQLFALGIDTRCHQTVDDIEGDIVTGIQAMAAQADLLFITGGLGPTSDDLTRNAVAKWAGRELAFDQGSWDHIGKMFARFSRDVPESNRQQCYFPAGARVLTNVAGTANAFTLTAHGKELWILPGPPREVEQVWTDHIGAALAGRILPAARKRLRMWRTIGKGESHLAEVIEPLLMGSRGQGVEVAYRAHAPYIELKVRFPEADAARFAPLCSAIQAALRPWLFEVDDQDVARQLVARLSRYQSVEIYDGVTQGQLAELLAPEFRTALTKQAQLVFVTSWEGFESPAAFLEQTLDTNPETEVALAVAGFDPSGAWAVGIRELSEKTVEERPSIYRGEAMQARNLKAIASLAAKAWLAHLDERN
jgi:molybdenum cofactor synthesis domain-containing protein